MKKKLLSFFVVFAVLLLFPVIAKAEGDKFKNNKCVIPYDLYLEYDGNEKMLRSSYGILVGMDDGGASNIITNAFDVRATGEELQVFYDELAIEEDKRDNVTQIIKVTVEKDIQITASINNVSESMNLAVLDLSSKIYNHNSVVLISMKRILNPHRNYISLIMNQMFIRDLR